MRREELVFIQHDLQNAPQARRLHQRKQRALVLARPCNGRDIEAQVRAMLDEPHHAPLEARHPVDGLGVQSSHREQRDQPHQRAYFHRDLAAIGHLQPVVEEAVFLIPQSAATHPIHRARDIEKMLEELARDVLVGFIVRHQLNRDA